MAARRALLSLAALVGGAGAAVCSPADSCSKLTDGLYCPLNVVTEHGDINRDAAQIAAALKEDPPNYARAKEIYTSGNQSSKGAGVMRTLQDLATKDMTAGGKYTNAFYSGAVDLYGSTNAVWQDIMIAGFDATGECSQKSHDFRAYIINKGAVGIVTAYATYEMGAAVWKAADGQTTDGGAAYAWDEAAAFYVGNIEPVLGDGYTGSAPGNLYSPYEVSWKRDVDFPDGVVTHSKAIPIMNYGLLNLRGADYDAAGVEAAQTAMYKIFSISAIRAAMKYSWKAYGDGTFQAKYLAEGWAFWHSASGYISLVNKTAVEEVDVLLDLSHTSVPADTPCKIKTLVESMYVGLGITCAMVGKWKDAAPGSCLDSICDDTGNTATMLAGSTAYLDMCKAVPINNDVSAASARVGGSLAAALVALVLSIAG